MTSTSAMYKGIELLNEYNYESWSTKVFAFGMDKGWAEEVLETSKPGVGDALVKWKKLNNSAYAFLCQTISPSQLLAYKVSEMPT